MDRNFKDFLQDEIERRRMSARQFAEFVDVAPSTVTRCVDEQSPAIPGLDFLIKLSTSLNISLPALVELAYPDYTLKTNPSAAARIMAQQIEQLPQAAQDVIAAIIRGMRS